VEDRSEPPLAPLTEPHPPPAEAGGRRRRSAPRALPPEESGTGASHGLSLKQKLAIDSLLVEPTIAKAAAAASVSERTLYRWLEDPGFVEEYNRHKRRLFGHGMAHVQRFSLLAAQTLAKVAADPNSPAHSKVAAATALLRFGREGVELDDLIERVSDLESQLASGLVPGPPAKAARRRAAGDPRKSRGGGGGGGSA
jgi:hypothetical protein